MGHKGSLCEDCWDRGNTLGLHHVIGNCSISHYSQFQKHIHRGYDPVGSYLKKKMSIESYNLMIEKFEWLIV